MGKNREKVVPYDKGALQYLRNSICSIRRTANGGVIPALKVDLDGLEMAVKDLPKEARECIEKFWGLNGSINHARRISAMRGKVDVASMEQQKRAIMAMRPLFTIDYMYMYDMEFRQLVENIMKKVDMPAEKTEHQETAEEKKQKKEVCKCILGYCIFMCNGPKMLFEEGPQEFDASQDDRLTFDEYALLDNFYEKVKNAVPDGAINIGLLKLSFEMLNLKDRANIKRSLKLPLDKEEEEQDKEPLVTFGEIRRFKERIFRYGNWIVLESVILGAHLETREEFENLMDSINELWKRNWDMEPYKSGKLKLATSQGERVVSTYTVGTEVFTDVAEIMLLRHAAVAGVLK